MINRRTLEWAVFGIIIWLVAEVLSLKKQLRVRRAEGFAAEGSADLESIKELNEFAKKMTTGEGVVAGNLKVTGNLTVDGDATIGPAYIGKWQRKDSNFAEFSHKDRVDGTHHHYTLISNKDGSTYLNSAHDKNIILRHNNDDWPSNNGRGRVNLDLNLATQKGIFFREGIGGYLINMKYASMPLISGRHRLDDVYAYADTDDWWIIMPGWKLTVWEHWHGRSGGPGDKMVDYHNTHAHPVKEVSKYGNRAHEYELTYIG